MKKYLIIAAMMAATAMTWAQPHGHLREKKEKVDAMKAAYITKMLDLTSAEAQQFWPVYNEMDNQIEKLRIATAEKMMTLRSDGKKIEDLSDDELIKLMNERLDNDEKIAQLRKTYHQQFLKILGVQKTAKLYFAEMEFTRELMRKTRQGPPMRPEDHRP
jgi:Spy/CpxP family protein refolding chaperone